MTSIDTIRLIILNNSRTEAERLISMLHNAGRPSRAQHVDSEEALVKLLQEKTWDLLISNDTSTNPTPQIALKHIRRLNKDVPVILLHDDEELFMQVDGMKMGAVDVVNLDDDQHLLLVIHREMTNRMDRQARRAADRRFRKQSAVASNCWIRRAMPSLMYKMASIFTLMNLLPNYLALKNAMRLNVCPSWIWWPIPNKPNSKTS